MNIVNILWSILAAFMDGFLHHAKRQSVHDKALRQHLSERQVDEMLQDTFPASDPPSTY